MPAESDGKVGARVELKVAGQDLTIDMRLPVRRTRPRELLPLYRGLTEHFTQAVLVSVEAGGRRVSCQAGCGACCRQLVPLADLEAWRIREVIEEMPEPRRTEVRERFAAARQRLAESGLLAALLDPASVPSAELTGFGDRYFREGIPCPFLENESCSIYEERPIICREYLVTSPPANCSHPTRENIRSVPVPSSVYRALRWLSDQPDGATWVPLILAPEWAESHPEPEPTRTGPELARELFSRLASDVLPPETGSPDVADSASPPPPDRGITPAE